MKAIEAIEMNACCKLKAISNNKKSRPNAGKKIAVNSLVKYMMLFKSIPPFFTTPYPSTVTQDRIP